MPDKKCPDGLEMLAGTLTAPGLTFAHAACFAVTQQVDQWFAGKLTRDICADGCCLAMWTSCVTSSMAVHLLPVTQPGPSVLGSWCRAGWLPACTPEEAGGEAPERCVQPDPAWRRQHVLG